MSLQSTEAIASETAHLGNLRGIGWTLLAGLFFVAVTGIVHYLGPGLPATEGAFIRYAFGIILLAPSLFRLLKRRPSRQLIRLSAVRGLVQGIAFMLWFYAMARIANRRCYGDWLYGTDFHYGGCRNIFGRTASIAAHYCGAYWFCRCSRYFTPRI